MTAPPASSLPSPALLPAIAQRRSLRAFDSTPIAESVLVRLLEAARWAPSSRNLQPWHFVLVPREDAAVHASLAAALTGRNPLWAPAAPLMIVALARLRDEQDRPIRMAAYDLGQAVAQLAIQAVAEGLMVHQMGGFDAAAVRVAIGAPEGLEPMTVIAVGRPGDPAGLPPELRALEAAPRTRRPLESFVSRGRYAG